MPARTLALCAVLAVTCGPALAQDAADKLDGAAYKDEEACAKGLNAEGCILSFFIEGKAAKTLFDGMTEKAEREECTGGLQKFNDSGLACFKYDDGTHTCNFGYHFKEKRFGGSHEDC